jgi:hypothetical protein
MYIVCVCVCVCVWKSLPLLSSTTLFLTAYITQKHTHTVTNAKAWLSLIIKLFATYLPTFPILSCHGVWRFQRSEIVEGKVQGGPWARCTGVVESGDWFWLAGMFFVLSGALCVRDPCCFLCCSSMTPSLSDQIWLCLEFVDVLHYLVWLVSVLLVLSCWGLRRHRPAARCSCPFWGEIQLPCDEIRMFSPIPSATRATLWVRRCHHQLSPFVCHHQVG